MTLAATYLFMLSAYFCDTFLLGLIEKNKQKKTSTVAKKKNKKKKKPQKNST